MAEHNNAPVDTEQVLKDMLDQVNKEVTEGMDDDSVDVAVILDDRVQARVEEAFRNAWNDKLRAWVEQRIQQEVAELGLKLGRNIAELTGSSKGRL